MGLRSQRDQLGYEHSAGYRACYRAIGRLVLVASVGLDQTAGRIVTNSGHELKVPGYAGSGNSDE